jgi:DNA polymerase-3 subunit epsilon
MKLSEFTTRKKIADFAGMIAFDKDDEEIFTFSKHKGIKVIYFREKNQLF